MQELMQIARQHPESVAFVFSQYGYKQLPVNGQSIKAMSVKFGHAFLKDLAVQIANDGDVSNFNFTAIGAGIKNLLSNKRNKTGAVTTAPRQSIGLVSSIGTPFAPLDIKAIPPRLQIAEGLLVKGPNDVVRLPTTQTASKNSFGSKILGLLEKGVGIYTGIKQTQMEANNQVYQQQKQEQKKSKTALIVGGVLVVLLIVGLIFYKGKKTIK